jgi:2,4-dienoyl-CoA reductase-like NADH-dependent reductase (Old Yellow Enzyme family)
MLFDEYRIGPLRLRNRIVRAATFEKLADEDGHVTDELVGLYARLAQGGAGLIITGAALVHPSGRYLRRMISAHSDTYNEGLRRIPDAVHTEGGLVALQADHGGRQCSPLLLGGEPPLGPSAIHDPVTGATPRPMEDQEIWEVIDAFASAAFRARTAGFDALELQASRGYLISSFLSPHTNRRDDYWGGDTARRSHFLEETLKAIRQAAGNDFPIIVKLNAHDHIEGGLGPEESLGAALVSEDIGAEAVEISGGMRESPRNASPPEDKEGHYGEAGAMFRKSLSIPVILTGGFRSRAAMEGAIERGEADLIGISRALIREPDLPVLMEGGKERSDCDACSECLRFSRMKSIVCTRRTTPRNL